MEALLEEILLWCKGVVFIISCILGAVLASAQKGRYFLVLLCVGIASHGYCDAGYQFCNVGTNTLQCKSFITFTYGGNSVTADMQHSEDNLTAIWRMATLEEAIPLFPVSWTTEQQIVGLTAVKATLYLQISLSVDGGTVGGGSWSMANSFGVDPSIFYTYYRYLRYPYNSLAVGTVPSAGILVPSSLYGDIDLGVCEWAGPWTVDNQTASSQVCSPDFGGLSDFDKTPDATYFPPQVWDYLGGGASYNDSTGLYVGDNGQQVGWVFDLGLNSWRLRDDASSIAGSINPYVPEGESYGLILNQDGEGFATYDLDLMPVVKTIDFWGKAIETSVRPLESRVIDLTDAQANYFGFSQETMQQGFESVVDAVNAMESGSGEGGGTVEVNVTVPEQDYTVNMGSAPDITMPGVNDTGISETAEIDSSVVASQQFQSWAESLRGPFSEFLAEGLDGLVGGVPALGAQSLMYDGVIGGYSIRLDLSEYPILLDFRSLLVWCLLLAASVVGLNIMKSALI